jgi:hypothetical protein
MTRDQKFTLFMTLSIIGGIGIGLSTIPAVGRINPTAPGMGRIIAGTLLVAIAMAWACFFAARAHFVQDEFKRQRSISASYWGGWLGIGASAPIFFFVAAGGFGPLAAMKIPPVFVFEFGYLLPTLFAAIGAIGARLWLRYRDR